MCVCLYDFFYRLWGLFYGHWLTRPINNHNNTNEKKVCTTHIKRAFYNLIFRARARLPSLTRSLSLYFDSLFPSLALFRLFAGVKSQTDRTHTHTHSHVNTSARVRAWACVWLSACKQTHIHKQQYDRADLQPKSKYNFKYT